jgi:small basic protein
MIALLIAVLAVCLGILLAALDHPGAVSDARTRRLSLALVAASAAAAVAGAVHAITGWLIA